MESLKIEEIIFLNKDKDFVDNLLFYFGSQEKSIERYIESINLYKRLSEYKKNLIKARLNYIIDKNTPLPHLTPFITAFFATVNLFPIVYSVLFGPEVYQYFLAIILSSLAVLYLLVPYKKEKKIIANSKYLLNLLNF